MDLAKVSANQKEPEGWRIGVFRDGWESDVAGWLETSAHGGENDGEQGRRKSCRGLELGKNRGGAVGGRLNFMPIGRGCPHNVFHGGGA